MDLEMHLPQVVEGDHDLDLDAPFVALGLHSLGMMTFASSLSKWANFPIDIFETFNSNVTIRSLFRNRIEALPC
jgi:acyl carrier protein